MRAYCHDSDKYRRCCSLNEQDTAKAYGSIIVYDTKGSEAAQLLQN